jgi:rRNA maturation protein Nop10
MKKMKLCTVCSNYTIEKVHCKQATIAAHPAPFNPNDPFGEQRRRAKGVAL